MNKLYTINWKLSNGYVISTCSFWREELLKEKMEKNPEWSFTKVEDNEVHQIWEAK